MTNEVKINVGTTPEQFGAEFIDAFHRAERGELTTPERHASFSDLQTMVRVLSPKRMQILRHVHQTPAKSVRALAQALGRDYRRVHEDVAALTEAGLLERDQHGIKAEYTALNVEMRVAL